MYETIYARIAELMKLDTRINNAAVETLGGEPTMMPYEFWEHYIPWSLNKSKEIEKDTKGEVVFAFCTNMILNDKRYLDLFKNYSKDPNLELFISWEEDTGRYGRNNKLFPRYQENVLSVADAAKTISLIPSKHLVNNKPVAALFAEVIDPLGINDISTDMLYQFGSGKEFFKNNQPDYGDISRWYIELSEMAKAREITLSPRDEIIASLLKDQSFHCMGNDSYDLEFEPDGTATLNSSMTGNEAIIPTRTLHIDDNSFAQKAIFENVAELDAKACQEHDFCFQCEYLTYCNGGYYHHKLLPKAELEAISEGDCPGFKKYWDYVSGLYPNRENRTLIRQRNRLRAVARREYVRPKEINLEIAVINESELPRVYDDFFAMITGDVDNIMIDQDDRYGKNYRERLWFYDSLGKRVGVTDQLLLEHPASAKVIENAVYGNYKNIKIPPMQVMRYVGRNVDIRISRQIIEAIAIMKFTPIVTSRGDLDVMPSGMIVDERNLELFEWAEDIDMLELRYAFPKVYDRVCDIAIDYFIMNQVSFERINEIKTVHRGFSELLSMMNYYG
jgi:sulfatase maturation enzyme AslB (radical SAM superfamily)